MKQARFDLHSKTFPRYAEAKSFADECKPKGFIEGPVLDDNTDRQYIVFYVLPERKKEYSKGKEATK